VSDYQDSIVLLDLQTQSSLDKVAAQIDTRIEKIDTNMIIGGILFI
jgi:hypothetical protein